jgi:hypothetical protein
MVKMMCSDCGEMYYVGNMCSCYDNIKKLASILEIEQEEFGLSVSWHDLKRIYEIGAEDERERLAKKIEKLPFGDTSQSFAVWVRQDV